MRRDVVPVYKDHEPADMKDVEERVQRIRWWLCEAHHSRVEEEEGRPSATPVQSLTLLYA